MRGMGPLTSTFVTAREHAEGTTGGQHELHVGAGHRLKGGTGEYTAGAGADATMGVRNHGVGARKVPHSAAVTGARATTMTYAAIGESEWH